MAGLGEDCGLLAGLGVVVEVVVVAFPVQFTTPLTRLAARSQPKAVETLCVGISESGDARRYGLSDAHITTLSDEIHLYLLLAGLKIAYGGALTGDLS